LVHTDVPDLPPDGDGGDGGGGGGDPQDAFWGGGLDGGVFGEGPSLGELLDGATVGADDGVVLIGPVDDSFGVPSFDGVSGGESDRFGPSVLAPVPSPGGALVLIVSGVGLATRRRR
jgi:hypothetical protein